jgi:hypothetical protein
MSAFLGLSYWSCPVICGADLVPCPCGMLSVSNQAYYESKLYRDRSVTRFDL